MLTDAGPLIALVDRKDVSHQRCVEGLEALSGALITTLPCVSEAMHVLHRFIGVDGQMQLWRWIIDGRVEIFTTDGDDLRRMHALMTKYADIPMDFGDASLVAAAENLKTNRIFALDSDFHIYRMADGSAFDVFPK